MGYALAVVGSITAATRLKKRVSETGACIPALVHTPSKLNCGGCSYSLRFREQYMQIIKTCASEANIPIKGIYTE
ncbi:MAG: DUF3343 domain-containing protein, partial [Clostridia bacterium]|nr:DUF3343 domain-containing protein [Clostridia bacterium]